MALLKLECLPGKTFPLGATILDGGVNFSVYSKNATGMELVLFPRDPKGELRIIPLDLEKNRTYFYWHVFVPGIGVGQQYGFRVYGQNVPEAGLRFDASKLLIDPYARAILGWERYDREKAASVGDNLDTALRSVVVDTSAYDWEGDLPLQRPYAESIIYELHVGGFTSNANSGVSAEKRGTFAGVVEKIPYLKELGVTAVELMPVHEYDPQSAASGLCNYWGYNTVAFMALHHGYCTDVDPIAGITEFKDMVKALHKAGIEVILDVVFNHTAEGNELGPTQSFRGLDNPTYYLLNGDNLAHYSNYSGCGNSFNVNHPVVGKLVLDCLRYWVTEMHVDGFRFDLAAALARDAYGVPSSFPPLLWAIESDAMLAGTKLIAEAWDAAGLYRVGWFINGSNWYAEWNGPFRDDVRRFVKGDTDSISRFAARITGSSDIYHHIDREPNRSINFITCHDGFTLNDLVSYNVKHNEENGENNRDGCDGNYSWNCGVEGPTDDASVNALRLRQMKNLLSVLFLSQGTPMLLMGDEVGRTQGGNNNAYCHDDESTWFDWSLVESNKGLLRFTKELIKFMQSASVFRQRKLFSACDIGSQICILFHGVKRDQPDWGIDSHSLAMSMKNVSTGEYLCVIFNAYWQELEFEVPEPGTGCSWHRICDTALAAPFDFVDGAMAPKVMTRTCVVQPRSTVVLSALSTDLWH